MYPSVAMNPAGNAVVVWYSQTQDGGTRGVYGQRLDANGNPAGGEFQVNTYTPDVQDWPTVAICESGRFVVTWTSYGQDGSDAGIFGQLFDPSGNKLFDEFRVNTYTTDRQKYPVVAMDADGRFVVAWQSRYQDGSEDGIYAQRFDNHAQPLGSEFRVNTVTQGYQILPAIAMNPDGNFVIAWTRDLQDGNGGNISMQRYAATERRWVARSPSTCTGPIISRIPRSRSTLSATSWWPGTARDRTATPTGSTPRCSTPTETRTGVSSMSARRWTHAQSVPTIAMHDERQLPRVLAKRRAGWFACGASSARPSIRTARRSGMSSSSTRTRPACR